MATARRTTSDNPLITGLLRDLRTVNRRHAARVDAAKESEAERDRVVRDAHAAGVTPTQIAAETGLSTQRIDQIRRGSRL